MSFISTRSLLAAAMLVGPGLSPVEAGNLFKCTDARGQVVYSDRACASEAPTPSAAAAASGKNAASFSNAAVKGKITEAAIAASSGMGAAAARHLAAKGAAVVLGARRTDRIDALVTEITEAGGKAIAVPNAALLAKKPRRLM